MPEPATTAGLWLSGKCLGSAFLGSVLANYASSLSYDLTKAQFAKLLDENDLDGDGLPRNHHLRRASQDAIRGAMGFALHAAEGVVGERPPLLTAIRNHWRAGTLFDQPLIEVRDSPEQRWLAAFRRTAKRRLDTFDDRIQFDDTDAPQLLRGEWDDGFRNFFHKQFDEWVAREVEAGDPPAAFRTGIVAGWPVGEDGVGRLTLFEAYCFFFREKLKDPTTHNAFAGPVLAEIKDGVDHTRGLLDAIGGRIDRFGERFDTLEQALAEGIEQIQQQLEELRPDAIRAALVGVIERAHQRELDEAEALKGWRDRESAREAAQANRQSKLGEIDAFLASLEGTIERGQSSPELQELIRILQSEGAEEALAYVTAKQSTLLADAKQLDRRRTSEVRSKLAPLFEKARLHQLRGELDDATSTIEGVVDIDDRWQKALAFAFWRRIDQCDHALRYATTSSARSHAELALSYAKRSHDRGDGGSEAERNLSVGHNRLGDLALKLGDTNAARDAYQAALDLRQKLANDDPGDAQAQRDLSISHNKIGNLALKLGDTNAARDAYQAALDLRQKLANDDPGDAQAQRDVMVSCYKLGSADVAAEEPGKAAGWYEQAVAVLDRMIDHGMDPENSRRERDLVAEELKRAREAG